MKKGMLLLIMIVTIGTGMWGYTQYEKNIQNNVFLENQFQRMFCDLVVDVENIQANLSKVMVTGSPKQNVLLFSDIMHLSYDAQEKLTQLPITHGNISRTEKFLSQVGDLSSALARNNLEGKPLSQDEKQIVERLHNYSNYLAQEFISLQKNIVDDGIRIGEIREKANKKLKETNKNMLTTNFLNIEEKMKEYPELIYDGPFSEHVKKIKSNLKGRNIDKKEIKEIAKDFIGDKIKYEATCICEIDNSRVPAYVVELKSIEEKDNIVTMAITKTGGHVLWMLDTREIKDTNISEKQAMKIAKDFLEKKGYKNMVSTYSLKYDGQMLINFAYMQDDVIVYTDLIKVKIGLDDGAIVGFEGEGYLFNHHKRDISTPKVSIDEAKDKISMYTKTLKPRLAIIPTNSGKEVLCYEFEVKYKDDIFLVYINTENGEEQKILQIIIKDDGVLML